MRLKRWVFLGMSCIWCMTAPAATPVFSTLYSFPSVDGGGAGGLAVDSHGVLYGAMRQGGTYGGGTVFSLTPPSTSGGAWSADVLWDFGAPGDIYLPNACLTLGNGVLYGSTEYPYGGAVFALNPPTSPGGAWTETVLHSFKGGSGGGSDPGCVTQGPDGALYGMTRAGGEAGQGTVFRVAPSTTPGGAWTGGALYSFNGGSDGAQPFGAVVIGPSGVIYGAAPHSTIIGNRGAVFSLAPPASAGGSWTFYVLYTFGGAPDGDSPVDLVAGTGGVLYGTTYSGGTHGTGTIYSLAPPASPGGSWTETVLNSFDADDVPTPGPLLASRRTGILYGTALGSNKASTIFELRPSASPGGSWTKTVLHTFTEAEGNPGWGLTAGRGGSLYGIAGDSAFSIKP